MTGSLLVAAQAAVVIACIFLGVRMGGIGLGLWGGVGVLVMAFLFRVPPGSPPVSAMLIILAVVLAAASMQAAGGVDYLVSVASRLVRKNPGRLNFVAPFVSFVFTVAAGTGNIFFPLIPVIYDVAYRQKIRPERALAVSATASQMGIMASPVSAATAALTTLLEPRGFNLVKTLAITIPASVAAILVAAVIQMRVGRNLEDDPEYQRRLSAGEIKPPQPAADVGSALPTTASTSAGIFLGAVLVVVLLGVFEGLRPRFPAANGSPQLLDMTVLIQILMLTAAAVIIIAAKLKPSDVLKAPVLTSGLVALTALFGIAWLADTFVLANSTSIVSVLDNVVKQHPYTFAVGLFAVGAMTTSQSGTIRSLVPIGLALGIPAQYIVAMVPAVIGIYFFPANGSQLAAVAIDQTGTTRIGKAIVNHSFMLSTLVMGVVAVVVGFAIASFVHGAR